MNPSDGGQKGKQLSDEVPVVWMLKAPKKSQHPASVLGDACIPSLWMPANGEVGRDGRLKHSDKPLILHKTISCFSQLKRACMQNEFK